MSIFHSPMALALGVLFSLLPTTAPGREVPRVELVKAPHQGFRPQVEVGEDGTVHVVQGDSRSRGDLFYVKKTPNSDAYSEPIRVNVTQGIVAGFDMTVGKNGRVHVLIRPNPKYLKLQMPEKEELIFWDLKYMLYARMNDDGTGFEEEHDLSKATLGFEGAGAIFADQQDRVFAFWHGQLIPKPNEKGRDIYRVVSTDGGMTFTDPQPVKTGVEGACQCCPLNGAWGPQGTIALSYRNSTENEIGITKDQWLLHSTDEGVSFTGSMLEPWLNAGCPGSVASVAFGPSSIFVAWRTKTTVGFAKQTDMISMLFKSPGGNGRIPQVAVNHEGDALCMWGIAGGRQAKGGGALAWRIVPHGSTTPTRIQYLKRGMAPNWGAATAYAKPDGDFVILYDGKGPPPDE